MKKSFVLGIILIIAFSFFSCGDGGGSNGSQTATLKIANENSNTIVEAKVSQWKGTPLIDIKELKNLNITNGNSKSLTINVPDGVDKIRVSVYFNTSGGYNVNDEVDSASGFSNRTLIFTLDASEVGTLILEP